MTMKASYVALDGKAFYAISFSRVRRLLENVEYLLEQYPMCTINAHWFAGNKTAGQKREIPSRMLSEGGLGEVGDWLNQQAIDGAIRFEVVFQAQDEQRQGHHLIFLITNKSE